MDDELTKNEAVMKSLQDAIETLERISTFDLSMQTGVVLKMMAIESIQRIQIRLHEAGIQSGANRIK